MSHHVLHIFQHGAFIGRERGFLICRPPEQEERRLPLDDIRAVVVAARGVTLGASALSALLERDAIILHCDDHYQPCGWSCPINRVTDLSAFEKQIRQPAQLNAKLWKQMLRSKTENQVRVLATLGIRSPRLALSLQKNEINEADCARHYWSLFFPAISYGKTRRNEKEESHPNLFLNYGYAVLAAICHRGIIVHGLLPQIGVHHKPRYRSVPLVYDLMEAFRAMVDFLLAEFLRDNVSPDLRAWAKKVGGGLKDFRVRKGTFTLKLLDAMDASASSLARAYATGKSDLFWLPEIPAEPIPRRDEPDEQQPV